MSAAPIYDQKHNIIAGVVLINDITEKRSMEKALQLAEQERASTQNRFLQLMAHELRNPMAGLSGLIDLLGRRLDKGRPTSELHHLMKREINRLSIMLNEILDAFRAQNDRLPLHKQCIDVNVIVTSALEPFVATEPDGRIISTLPTAPTWVFGDPCRLEDVIRNLVSNALKYSPSDSGIEIALRENAESALLYIKDHGVGIPEADQLLIFNRFYRASNVATNGPGGVGLGLFVCRDIREKHDGRIWVESKHGCGSTFFVQLPIYNKTAPV
jgi:signal transduction histidine kinase